MPADKPTISAKVYEVLQAARAADGPFDDDSKLSKGPFWFGASALGFLAVPFTRISDEFGGASIYPSECKQLKTVNDCVTLVLKRANTQPPTPEKPLPRSYQL